MNIEVTWDPPIKFSFSHLEDNRKDSRKKWFRIDLADGYVLRDIPEESGVYIFARHTRKGDYTPLYIGKSNNLYNRIYSHCRLSAHFSLRKCMMCSPKGQKVLFLGKIKCPKSQSSMACDLVESVLIHKAILKKLWFEMCNRELKKKQDKEETTIKFKGNLGIKKFFGTSIKVPKDARVG